MASLLNRTVSLTAIALQTGFFSLALVNRPVSAANWNQFDVCVAELERREINAEQASTACAEALKPKDLSFCVLKINAATSIAATDALQACFKVRRPLDLADCVFDITNDTEGADPQSTLDHCRRSLLPNRFSECVVGLTRQAELVPAKAMETCINAEDFPRNLFPDSSM